MASTRALGRMLHGVKNTLLQPSYTHRILGSGRKICCMDKCGKNVVFPRLISTTSLSQASDSEEKKEDIIEPPNFMSNLFGYTTPESETELISEDEKKDREQMFNEISDMYFAKPRQNPTIEFYEKAVDLLVKYNDDHGIEVIWRLLEESDLEPPEEMLCKMEECLGRAKEASWFK
eukprot:gene6997-7782_t